MDTQRIDGIKYNLDRLTIDEVKNIHGHLLARHAALIGDIALIEQRIHDQTGALPEANLILVPDIPA